MLPFLNQGTIATLRNVKEKLDKYYTIVIGCLWTLSTLWDIITFHCYWSDYMLELYSCFFIASESLRFLFSSLRNYLMLSIGSHALIHGHRLVYSKKI